ncbi:MAG: hypothetical protein HQ522_15645, partial [Bacteroidetes bacterium]|nr:hypothetical protein [Bacteroidota bacterium]
MATLITKANLKQLDDKKKIIENVNWDNFEGTKYDITIGSRFLKAKFGQPVAFDELRSHEKRLDACVEPGEVVFVLSNEKFCLPSNIKLNLLPKRSLSHDGISVL